MTLNPLMVGHLIIIVRFFRLLLLFLGIVEFGNRNRESLIIFKILVILIHRFFLRVALTVHLRGGSRIEIRVILRHRSNPKEFFLLTVISRKHFLFLFLSHSERFLFLMLRILLLLGFPGLACL